MTRLADASGAYTTRTAIEMGRHLERLGFAWFEGPLYEWEGYVGYELLPPALDIAIAGAEVTFSRAAIREQLDRGAFDIIQPDPVDLRRDRRGAVLRGPREAAGRELRAAYLGGRHRHRRGTPGPGGPAQSHAQSRHGRAVAGARDRRESVADRPPAQRLGDARRLGRHPARARGSGSRSTRRSCEHGPGRRSC